MCDTVVYLGPTLPSTEAALLLDAEYLPPIRRGDLARLSADVRFVGIVDGEFFQSLAVSPKEILPLLRRGVTVAGAASMGALRAAETHRFGMVGVGSVFEMYRDGVLDADDEVALVYDPESYRQHSEPLVNLRAALEMAAGLGVISDDEKQQLVGQLKSLYFPERSLGALERLCPKVGDLFRNVPLPDVKRKDAIELLKVIKRARESACDSATQATWSSAQRRDVAAKLSM